MKNVYNKLLSNKLEIINRLLDKKRKEGIQKEAFIKLKEIHHKENINKLAKRFYHDGDFSLFVENDLSMAEMFYDIALDMAFDDVLMYLKENTNNPNQIINYYKQLIELGYDKAKYELADYYLNTLKDIDNAMKYYEGLLDTKYFSSYISLGTYYMQQGLEDKANFYFNKVEGSTASLEFIELLESYLKNGKTNKVNDMLNKIEENSYEIFLPEIVNLCLKYKYDPQVYIDKLLNSNSSYDIISLINIYLKYRLIDKANKLTNLLSIKDLHKVIESHLKYGYIDKAISYVYKQIDSAEFLYLNESITAFFDYHYEIEAFKIIDYLEDIIFNNYKDEIETLLEIFLTNHLNDRLKKWFDKTSQSKEYNYSKTMIQSCLMYNKIDEANIIFTKIIADNRHYQIIDLIGFYLNLNMKQESSNLEKILIDSKDNFYISLLIGVYLKYELLSNALLLTKDILKSYYYDYMEIYDYSYIFMLVSVYLENNKLEELKDITHFILNTSKDKNKLKTIYQRYGYEQEFNDILKERS